MQYRGQRDARNLNVYFERYSFTPFAYTEQENATDQQERKGKVYSPEPVFISGLLYSIRSWLLFLGSLQPQSGAPT